MTNEQLQSIINSGELVISFPDEQPAAETPVSAPTTGGTFFDLFQSQIRKKELAGSQRTIETYRGAFRRFRRFRDDEDLMAYEVTPDLVEAYQGYLRAHNLTMNTVSFYMRILRAVYHKAVERGLTADRRPFRNVYTGQAKTVKRDLPLQTLKRLRTMHLETRELQFARDMFMLSFYMRGMSFVDMAYLKRADIRDGVLHYKRRKTGQMLSIRWERQMEQIVSRYPGGVGDYLLPIIRRDNGKERSQYRYASVLINASLHAISNKLQLNTPLTMYCARHSWATVARDLNMPTEVISSAMGHTNTKTTEIYLRSIDISVIDNANQKIIESV